MQMTGTEHNNKVVKTFFIGFAMLKAGVALQVLIQDTFLWSMSNFGRRTYQRYPMRII